MIARNYGNDENPRIQSARDRSKPVVPSPRACARADKRSADTPSIFLL